jgi:WD40 repeat protein
MRPAERPVDSLAVALAAARGDPHWRKLKGDLIGPDPARTIAELANDLRVNAGTNEATILIPIDQGEELFGVSDPDEAKCFLEILSHTLSENMPFLAVIAVRSDYLGELQSVVEFDPFPFGQMPLARIPQIIEGPARVAGIEVEETFVRQATHDARTQDALPLLAFALRKLWDRSPNKILGVDNYNALGDGRAGLNPLENAVRQAADEVLARAKPRDAELAALREAFVPAMVRVNDEGEYVRHPASLDALPAESHRLLRRLEDARLISRPEGDALMVEVAHEALLRKWPLLRSWLDAGREFLIGKQQLERDLRDWENAAEKSRALLAGLKLDRARGWVVERFRQLTVQERNFILASVESAKEVERQKLANESRTLAALSQAASLQGRYTDAVKLALAAWPRSATDERPMLSRAIDALGLALSGPLEISPPLRHNASISAVTFSPDSKWVVTTADKTTQVWDAATGVPIGKPLQHKDRVWRAAFSPDGARVVTASEDNTAQVWNAATGTPIGRPLLHESPVNSAAFSPHGNLVVTGSGDKSARIWDAVTGAPIGKPMQHDDQVLSAEFSRDGARLVTASFDKTARLWNAATQAPIGNPLEHKSSVISAAFSRDGTRVVTNSDAGRVWDAATGAPIGKPMEHEDTVTGASFSPDGGRVVTASWDNTARVWDAACGDPIGQPLQHKNLVNSAAFSPDGVRVVTASEDKTVQVWNATIGAPIGGALQHDGPVLSAAFSPDGARVVTGSDDKTARVWDAATGAQIGEALLQEAVFMRFRRDGPPLVFASGRPAFSRDGRLVVTASGRTAKVWDAVTGAPIGKPMQHDSRVLSAEFSPRGALVVTASDDKAARVWDAATWTPIGKPLQHEGQVNSVAFSPDGAHVVTASNDQAARVWDAVTGTRIGKTLQHEGQVSSAVFSPDGARVVTASYDKTARVWDAATGAPIGKPLEHEGAVRNVAFGPDGARVVTTSNDKTVRVWDAATWLPIGEAVQHDHTVRSALFSPDGERILTAYYKTAQVWDAKTGVPIGQPLRHEWEVRAAAFGPHGASVATLSDDNTVRVWRIPPVAPDIVATACRMLRNNDPADLFTRYGVDVKDPICTGEEPAPDPLRMINR